MISEDQHDQFQKQIETMKPELVLNFLFTQNEMKKSPYIEILEKKDPCIFLKPLNSWSEKNSNMLKEQFESKDNEIKRNDWHNAFRRIDKTLTSRFSNT